MQKIGLTGNIAAGKSEVEKILKNLGFFVVDLDKVSHDLLDNDEEVKKKILCEFNTLKRSELAKIIFQNPDKKNILEQIIHPKLKKYVLDLFLFNTSELIIISGALLYEAEFDKFFDKIIYIDAPYELRLKRLIKRNNLSIEDAKKRMEFQKDNKNRADYLIENNDTIKNLENKVKDVIKELEKK